MKRNFIQKIIYTIKYRRAWLPQMSRGFLLFIFTRLFLKLFSAGQGIVLGKNIRLQWPFSLKAEGPNAKIKVGHHSIIYENAIIESYGTGLVEIGHSNVIGDTRIYCRKHIFIGDRVLTSWNVLIQDFDAHPTDPDLRALQVQQLVDNFRPSFGKTDFPTTQLKNFDFPSDAIHIGNDVWIGANSTLLKGASIGNGCLVAAGSVVTKGTYPNNSILAGNPAKVVRIIVDPQQDPSC